MIAVIERRSGNLSLHLFIISKRHRDGFDLRYLIFGEFRLIRSLDTKNKYNNSSERSERVVR